MCSPETPLRLRAAGEQLGALRLPEVNHDGRTHTVSRSQALCVVVYLQSSGDPRSRQLKAAVSSGTGAWVAVRIGSLTTQLREFQALHCLQHTRFSKAVLCPRKKR